MALIPREVGKNSFAAVANPCVCAVLPRCRLIVAGEVGQRRAALGRCLRGQL
jgi:hypothetical protein